MPPPNPAAEACQKLAAVNDRLINLFNDLTAVGSTSLAARVAAASHELALAIAELKPPEVDARRVTPTPSPWHRHFLLGEARAIEGRLRQLINSIEEA